MNFRANNFIIFIYFFRDTTNTTNTDMVVMISMEAMDMEAGIMNMDTADMTNTTNTDTVMVDMNTINMDMAVTTKQINKQIQSF